MGDTFNKIGGHNLVEPAINKNIILIGPNYNTCIDMVNLLNGIVKIKDISQLNEESQKIIDNKIYLDYGIINFNCIKKYRKDLFLKLDRYLKKTIY